MPRIYHRKKFQQLAPAYYRSSDRSQTTNKSVWKKAVVKTRRWALFLISQLGKTESTSWNFYPTCISCVMMRYIFCYNFLLRFIITKRYFLLFFLRARRCAVFSSIGNIFYLRIYAVSIYFPYLRQLVRRKSNYYVIDSTYLFLNI